MLSLLISTYLGTYPWMYLPTSMYVDKYVVIHPSWMDALRCAFAHSVGSGTLGYSHP